MPPQPNETRRSARTATIANGQSLCTEDIDLTGVEAVAIETPSTLAGATMTFQGKLPGDTAYKNVYAGDTGAEYQVQIGVDRIIPLDPAIFLGLVALKIRTGTAATPTNQTGSRVFALAVRPL